MGVRRSAHIFLFLGAAGDNGHPDNYQGMAVLTHPRICWMGVSIYFPILIVIFVFSRCDSATAVVVPRPLLYLVLVEQGLFFEAIRLHLDFVPS